MVDVTAKPVTTRLAVARGEIHMRPETVRLAAGGRIPKGNVIEAARMAGIMAAKRTGDLIPLCHPLGLTGVEVSFRIGEDRIQAESTVITADRTGVEMEALTAVSVALLTVYDMCKAVDRDMVISHIRLDKKTGGLDLPCEAMLRGDTIVASNMDWPFPGFRNSKHQQPATLSVIKLGKK